MQLYSQFPVLRARQVASDITALAIVVVSVIAGVGTYAAISVLGQIGEGMQSAGSGIGSTMSEAAVNLGRIPLIGTAASSPFTNASAAGEALSLAGKDQQELVSRFAVILGILVVLVPVALVARFWLRPRVRFAKAAIATRQMAETSGGRNILALRALETLPASRLAAVGADPAGQWRVGDVATIERLTDEALRQAGIRRR